MSRPEFFFTLEEVLDIHEQQIVLYGGEFGLRDRGLLESALAMPQSMFSGKYLHGDLFEMAAAYLFHLVQNHPFLDGNKRTGTVLAYVFLRLNGLHLTATPDELELIVLDVACGRCDKKHLADFFRKNSSR